MERQELIHLHSNVVQNGEPKSPSASSLNYGEIAINYNSEEPSLFIKDGQDNIVKFNAVTKKEIEENEMVVAAALNYLNDSKEDLANKTVVINAGSTNIQYPGAKAVYDAIKNKMTKPSSDGSNGQVLVNNGEGGYYWDSIVGNVSSVGLEVCSGLTVSGSPITSQGTFKIDIASGYTLPTLESYNAKYTKPSSGIPKYDLEPSVQMALQKAETSLQQGGDISQFNNDCGYTSNIGTITEIIMNGASKGTVGVVDLGNVVTEVDVSNKEDKSNKSLVLNVSSTTEQYPSSKTVYDNMIERVIYHNSDYASIAPNLFHIWGEMHSLTIELVEPTDDGRANEYMLQFSSPSDYPTSFSYPSSILWAESNATDVLSGVTYPLIRRSKTYQISIINDLGRIGEF